MTTILLMVCMVGLCLAMRPMGMAGEPDGGGVAAEDTAGIPETGQAAPDPEGDDEIVDAVLAADEGGVPDEDAGDGERIPPDSEAEQPDGETETSETESSEQPAPNGVEAVLQQFGVAADDPRLEGFAPEQREALAGILNEFWQGRYEPAAQKVVRDYQTVQQQLAEQDQYYRVVDEWQKAPEYQLATQIVQTPGALERVQAALRGEAVDAAVDLDAMDPEVRRVHEAAQRSAQQVQELREQLDEFRRAQEQQTTAQQQRQTQMGERVAGDYMERLEADAAKELGFDPRAYQSQWQQAWRHVAVYLQHEGGAGEPGSREQLERVGDLFRQGLRLAGFDEIRAKRAKAASNVVRPPGQRQGAGAVETDEGIVEAALAEAGLQ